MKIATIPAGLLETNCYLVQPDGGRTLYVIDPGGDAPDIVREAEKFDYDRAAVLLTHDVAGLNLPPLPDAEEFGARADRRTIDRQRSEPLRHVKGTLLEPDFIQSLKRQRLANHFPALSFTRL